LWPGQRHRDLITAFEIRLCCWNVARTIVAIAGHADEGFLAMRLRSELILNERFARQVQDDRLPEIKARQINRLIDSLQPGDLKCRVAAASFTLLGVLQHLPTLGLTE